MAAKTEALDLPVVGNDVVDLDQPRCAGKAEDTRFVDRVFTAFERERIVEAPDPDRALWRRWAAKESAYKVVTKLLGPTEGLECRVDADCWDRVRKFGWRRARIHPGSSVR